MATNGYYCTCGAKTKIKKRPGWTKINGSPVLVNMIWFVCVACGRQKRLN